MWEEQVTLSVCSVHAYKEFSSVLVARSPCCRTSFQHHDLEIPDLNKLQSLTIEAIMFWRSIDGGSMDVRSAKQRWDNMAANYRSLGIPYKMDGPEHSPLRLRVHMFDDLDYNSLHTQSKGHEALVVCASQNPAQSLVWCLESRDRHLPPAQSDVVRMHHP